MLLFYHMFLSIDTDIYQLFNDVCISKILFFMCVLLKASQVPLENQLKQQWSDTIESFGYLIETSLKTRMIKVLALKITSFDKM